MESLFAAPPTPAPDGAFATAVDQSQTSVIRRRVTRRFEIYNPHSVGQLQAIKGMGFHQVILDWPNLHAAATQLGLDVVLANWWTPETENQTLEKGIQVAKQVERSRLVGVSIMDEPERNSPATPFSYYEALYVDLRDRFNRELPGVELEISHWGPLASWSPDHYEAFKPLYRATDRIRLMPYPDLNEGPLNEVFYQMLRSRQLMKLAGRELPQIVILQTWVMEDDPKLPTIEELRVMGYQAMLSGAETVSFFHYDPELWSKTPGFSDGFADLMRELTDFSRRYAEADVEARMHADGVLEATLRNPGKAPVTVLVNTNRQAARGLAALEVKVTVAETNSSDCARGARPIRPRRFLRSR